MIKIYVMLQLFQNGINFEGSGINIQIIFTVVMCVSIPRSLNQLEDSCETTSLSSQESKKIKSAVFIKEMAISIRAQQTKNEQKYRKIISDNPEFSFSLYKPKITHTPEPNTELLSAQLDRLMEDQYVLEKELSKINFQNQENQQLKIFQTSSKMDHYSFLRNAWKKSMEQQTAEEKINSLSHTVGSIKGHIKHMCKIQNQNSLMLTELIKSSKQYRQLQEKLQQQSEKKQKQKQKLRETISKLKQRIIQTSEENLSLLQKLHNENNVKKMKDEQIVRLKEQIQRFEIQILHKQRESKKIMEQMKNSHVSEIKKEIIVTSIDNSFSLILKSELLLEDEKNIETNKSLTELKNFLEKSPRLSKLIENGKSQLYFKERAAKLIPKQENFGIYVPEKKRISIDKNYHHNNNRSDFILGSQEKKKRFERTRQ